MCRPASGRLRISELFRRVSLVGNDLDALVVATALAYAVSEIDLAALRALNKICRSLELPDAGASLHLSRMRNFLLRYCHFISSCEPALRILLSVMFFFGLLLFRLFVGRLFLFLRPHFCEELFKRGEPRVALLFGTAARTVIEVLSALRT